jgi:hypothetical protein
MRPKLSSPRGNAAQIAPYGKQLIQARGVATRYGIHLGSISRWIARGVIPPPDQIICRRRYWFLTTLEAVDRRHTVEHAKTAQLTDQSAS